MVFDSSVTMLEAAQAGTGIAIAPVDMFTHLLNSERIVQPFATQIDLGSYWLTRLQSRQKRPQCASLLSGWWGRCRNKKARRMAGQRRQMVTTAISVTTVRMVARP
jgi:DNA-binding transcriptional LysR family regulator